MMRHRVAVSRFVVVCVCALIALGQTCVEAKGRTGKPKKAKKEKPSPIKATGTISVVKDEKGKVTDATFSADEGGKYSILVGKGGKKLSKLEGKHVEISGLVMEKDGATLLKISRCKPVKEPKGGAGEEPKKKGKGKKGDAEGAEE